MSSDNDNAVLAAHAIHPPTPMATRDPFLFCVYHRDLYPEGDEKMRAPRRGNGADFDGHAPYRMYHGDRVPGFPQVRCAVASALDARPTRHRLSAVVD